MKKIVLFLHSFAIAFFGFSLMIMWAVLWLQPYSSPKEISADSYVSIPKNTEQWNILIVHEAEPCCYSLLSFQPKQGVICLQNNLPPDVPPVYHREIQISNTQLSSLATLLNGVDVFLEQPLSYDKNGIHVILESGNHKLNGEQLPHYVEQYHSCPQVMKCIIQQILPALCQKEGQALYLSMLDCMDSDLSVADYDNYIDNISFILRMVENPYVCK